MISWFYTVLLISTQECKMSTENIRKLLLKSCSKPDNNAGSFSTGLLYCPECYVDERDGDIQNANLHKPTCLFRLAWEELEQLSTPIIPQPRSK